MKYTIVKSATAEGLTKGVNQMLASGWRLQGGVSTNVLFDSDYLHDGLNDNGTSYFFAQAMVK